MVSKNVMAQINTYILSIYNIPGPVIDVVENTRVSQS